ncbi:period circadian protein-like [Schistocerca nitens]|uniref:period circadian protein-like n=1 Tax=Schistocerca nitens TaxID=7011 RepID=UPI00211924A3|nr:period circadian protein-like [Schistocerca nitens]
MKEEREAPSTAASAPGTASPASGATTASVASRSCKAPDSACSVGNSQSQRSGSSKSRISNSSGSSGYGGHPSTLSSGNDAFPPPRSKDKDHRKKKLKAEQAPPEAPSASSAPTAEAAAAPLSRTETDAASAAQAGASPAGAAPPSAPELAEEAAPAAEADAQAPGAASAAAGGVAAQDDASAAFSQSLSCPSSSNSNGAVEAEAEASPQDEKEFGARSRSLHQGQTQPQQPAAGNKDELTVVVSMQDGAVIYTSPSITQALSFPRDMWVGKSFIDYVHPDDRLALIQNITSGVALPRRKGGSSESSAKAPSQAPLFCRLRRYPSLRDGFAVAERRLVHRPFSLQLSFYELPASASGGAPAALPPGVLLTVTATAVCSAYTRPDEKPAGGNRFSTRHQADGKLTHVDGEAVSLLGYLPQQLLGRPVFDIYHPADLRGLQRVYRQLVSKECESTLHGEPYRLRAHNGCYARVRTEWSSFVNPWTKRLEFVIGQHCVLQGPSWPDVFAEAQDEEMFGEELLQESKAVQKEILQVLQEEVCRGEPGTDRRDISKRCKDLASFMESLIGEIGKPELRVDRAAAATANRMRASFSERSSVTLGEISPHRDYYDSKSSSETPPSYNQLNYDDNIQRFFESKPKTIPSDDSGERLMALEPTSRSTDEDTKAAAATNDSRATRNCLSPVNDTGSGSNSGSGSGSAGVSANNASVDTAEAEGDYKPPQLTEALLSRHNEDMEKRMVQRHREQRSKGGDGKCRRPHHCQPPVLADKAHVESAAPPAVAAQVPAGATAHGTKRSGSHSWDGEPLKASKHSHAPSPPAAPPPPAPLRDEAPPPAAAPGPPPAQSPAAAEGAGLSLWPPFSVAMTPLHSPQPCKTRGNFCTGGCSHAAPQILPLYYLPAPTPASAGATPVGSGARPHRQPHAPAAFLQQQGGPLPYVAAGVLYQAAPLLYPLAPPPPPSPSHLLALHQPLLHHHHQQHHQHPSTYQLSVAPLKWCPQQCLTFNTVHFQFSKTAGTQNRITAVRELRERHRGRPRLPFCRTRTLSLSPSLELPRFAVPPPPQPLTVSSAEKLTGAARSGVSASVPLPESACQQSSVGQQHQNQHRQHHQSYQHQPLPRPASCATSVKVEPGSSAASVAASVLNRGASDGSQKCCRTSGEEETEAEDSGSGSGLRGRGQSSSSYTYSFLRSDGDSCRDADGAATGAEDMLWERMDNGSSEGTSKRRPILKDPPWLENVEVTPDLMFRYQVSERELNAVLKDDLQKLRAISQPMLVNEQLGQLYLDMARAGGKELGFEEGELTSSSSGSGNDSAGAEAGATLHRTRKKRRSLEYSKLVMIFEENAPMPSPVSQPA